jgi:hypothetical protein
VLCKKKCQDLLNLRRLPANVNKNFISLSWIAVVALLASGCSSGRSQRAGPVPSATGAGVDLRAYSIATVTPFQIAPRQRIDSYVAEQFAGDIAARIRNDFGPLFAEVRRGAGLGKQGEVVISGTITSYRRGSAGARSLLGPLALPFASAFEADLTLTDAATQKILVSAPLHKFCGWPASAVSNKGIEWMMTECAAAVANTIARAKGWSP